MTHMGGEISTKRYANVANVLSIANVSTVIKWFGLCDAVFKQNVKVWMTLVKDMKWSDVETHFTAAFSEQR